MPLKEFYEQRHALNNKRILPQSSMHRAKMNKVASISREELKELATSLNPKATDAEIETFIGNILDIITKESTAIKDANASANNEKNENKKKVICSIGELIEKEILSEDKAKEAYALGFKDALIRAEHVEIDLGVEPPFVAEIEIEYDEDDSDSAEQAVYDKGVEDADIYVEDADNYAEDEFNNDIVGYETEEDEEVTAR
jgi:hypothetical protein